MPLESYDSREGAWNTVNRSRDTGLLFWNKILSTRIEEIVGASGFLRFAAMSQRQGFVYPYAVSRVLLESRVF